MGNMDKKYRREKSIEIIIENESSNKKEQKNINIKTNTQRKGINGYDR
jgi:hypothetical protein